jgi:hypothetical protein
MSAPLHGKLVDVNFSFDATSIHCSILFMIDLILHLPPQGTVDSSPMSYQVTLLVQNYRSHADIIRTPNSMFCLDRLKECGDQLIPHKCEYHDDVK